jgi:hypothetical protein
MTEHPHDSISITLSPVQIDAVVRAASQSRAPSISTLIMESLNAPLGAANGARARSGSSRPPARAQALRGYLPAETADPRLSRSLLRGLSLLSGFDEGAERGIVELAEELGMSPSTAHRYALTLVELGLLERCPKTRKYRLPDVQ